MAAGSKISSALIVMLCDVEVTELPALLTSTLLLMLIYIHKASSDELQYTAKRIESHCLLLAHVMPVRKLSMFRKEGESWTKRAQERGREEKRWRVLDCSLVQVCLMRGVGQGQKVKRQEERLEYRGGKIREKNGVLKRNG